MGNGAMVSYLEVSVCDHYQHRVGSRLGKSDIFATSIKAFHEINTELLPGTGQSSLHWIYKRSANKGSEWSQKIRCDRKKDRDIKEQVRE